MDEEQTSRLQEQKGRDFLQKDLLFEPPGVEDEGKVLGETLQALSSKQTDLWVRIADLLQDQLDVFSTQKGEEEELEDLLLERKVVEEIIQGLEQRDKGL